VTTDLKGGPPQSQGHKNFGKTFAWNADFLWRM
jgi:hypothetical protein